MALNLVRTENDLATLTRRVLEELFASTTDRVGVRLWDGTRWPDDRPRPTTLVLRQPGALRDMLLPGTELALAETYLYDGIDIEGDIEGVFVLADSLAAATDGWRRKLRVGSELLRLPSEAPRQPGRRPPADLSGRQHSPERDRAAVRYHYDVSNDFYALWLDRRMVYSCAYFKTPDDDLDTAQTQKLEHICRKLRLERGQRLLDIGCGWGGLLLYAAQQYGVEAVGVTLSQPQADLANQRTREAGLDPAQCRVLVQDYREIEPSSYDRLVSVGMFEHVGRSLLPTYFAQAQRLLKPGGLFLNHGIAYRATERPQHGPSFSDKYVFPDGETVPINVTLQAAEDQGFEVRDVESLREHYALTLRHWVRRLEAQHAAALRYVDEPTYRVWRLYMAGSADGFRQGRLNVYQTLLVKPEANGTCHMPLTRAYLYQ